MPLDTTSADLRLYREGVKDGIEMAAKLLDRLAIPGEEGDRFAAGVVATVAGRLAAAVRSLGNRATEAHARETVL